MNEEIYTSKSDFSSSTNISIQIVSEKHYVPADLVLLPYNNISRKVLDEWINFSYN